MACLMSEALRAGWRSWEKTALLATYLLPLAARACGMGLGIIIGPPFMAVLLALLARRAWRPAPRPA
jgi:hypothetical protein